MTRKCYRYAGGHRHHIAVDQAALDAGSRFTGWFAEHRFKLAAAQSLFGDRATAVRKLTVTGTDQTATCEKRHKIANFDISSGLNGLLIFIRHGDTNDNNNNKDDNDSSLRLPSLFLALTSLFSLFSLYYLSNPIICSLN